MKSKLISDGTVFTDVNVLNGESSAFIEIPQPDRTGIVFSVAQIIVELVPIGPMNADERRVCTVLASDSLPDNPLGYIQNVGASDVVARVMFGTAATYSTGGSFAFEYAKAASTQYLSNDMFANVGLAINVRSELQATYRFTVLFNLFEVAPIDFLKLRTRCTRWGAI